jgi:hypothetical protein
MVENRVFMAGKIVDRGKQIVWSPLTKMLVMADGNIGHR